MQSGFERSDIGLFLRKLYYEKATGMVLYSDMCQGGIKHSTIEEDIAKQLVLAEYTNNLDALGVMEWTEPDAEIEAQFAKATGFSVDIRGTATGG